MRIEFLGTSSSFGVPEIGCDCTVCTSDDARDRRLRCAIWVTTPTVSVVVDTPPDFHFQCRRANIRKLDAVLLTHLHADHIFGMDDVRRFNVLQQKSMPIYLPRHMQAPFSQIFHYGLTEPAAQLTRPRFDLRPIDHLDTLTFGDLTVRPVRLLHSGDWIHGYVFEHAGWRVAYLTDCHRIDPADEPVIAGVDVMVVGALWRSERTHPGHLNLGEALALARRLEVKSAYFTHITHYMGRYAEVEPELPPGMHLAHDRLVLEGPDAPTDPPAGR